MCLCRVLAVTSCRLLQHQFPRMALTFQVKILNLVNYYIVFGQDMCLPEVVVLHQLIVVTSNLGSRQLNMVRKVQ